MTAAWAALHSRTGPIGWIRAGGSTWPSSARRYRFHQLVRSDTKWRTPAGLHSRCTHEVTSQGYATPNRELLVYVQSAPDPLPTPPHPRQALGTRAALDRAQPLIVRLWLEDSSTHGQSVC